MKLKDITKFHCGKCGTFRPIKKMRCEKCGTMIKAGAMCISEKLQENGLKSSLYSCYRPPRPKDMTPVEYYRKYRCVDDGYTRVCKGRYYCNPAHCSSSWKDRKTRDRHLDMAYSMLG
jgi:hypothetical protein